MRGSYGRLLHPHGKCGELLCEQCCRYGHVRCGPVNVVCLFCVVALWMLYVCYVVDSQLRVDLILISSWCLIRN